MLYINKYIHKQIKIRKKQCIAKFHCFFICNALSAPIIIVGTKKKKEGKNRIIHIDDK